jgi:hypothetical protein
MTVSVPVSASAWIPVSAYYPHDDNIKIESALLKWNDGFTVFEHPAFNENVDYSINRETAFYLPTAKTLFSFIEETPLSAVYQGTYVVLSIDTGSYLTSGIHYITVIDDELFLSPLSTDSSFFRLLLNDDGSFSLLQGTGYVTVMDTTPFNLTIEPAAITEGRHTQRFYYQREGNQIYITTKTTNPASPGPATEERFWSYSKVGPEKGRMRANGILTFSDYVTAGVQSNDYLFNVNGFDIYYDPTGLTIDHIWVRYYNELEQKEHNKDVAIYTEKSVSGVFVSHLFDLPYKSQINIVNRGMAMNFANLKNISTGEYEYAIKP